MNAADFNVTMLQSLGFAAMPARRGPRRLFKQLRRDREVAEMNRAEAMSRDELERVAAEPNNDVFHTAVRNRLKRLREREATKNVPNSKEGAKPTYKQVRIACEEVARRSLSELGDANVTITFPRIVVDWEIIRRLGRLPLPELVRLPTQVGMEWTATYVLRIFKDDTKNVRTKLKKLDVDLLRLLLNESPVLYADYLQDAVLERLEQSFKSIGTSDLRQLVEKLRARNDLWSVIAAERLLVRRETNRQMAKQLREGKKKLMHEQSTPHDMTDWWREQN